MKLNVNFDVRQSRLAVWLNVVGALIAIVGVLGKAFSRAFPFVNVAISMPLWVLLAVVGVLPSLALLVGKQHKHPKSSQLDTSSTGSSSEPNDYFKAQALEEELANLRTELATYKSLEREVMGLLASGAELNLNEILERLDIKHQPNGARLLRLAIASLQEEGKVIGIGGLMARLKGVSPSIRESA